MKTIYLFGIILFNGLHKTHFRLTVIMAFVARWFLLRQVQVCCSAIISMVIIAHLPASSSRLPHALGHTTW